MRTVRISWKKLLLVILLCGLAYYVIGPFVFITPPKEEILMAGEPIKKANENGNSITVYRTDGSLGNFEKYESPKNGPGEMGKSHRLKPEQRAEEDRLKSVYGFNQLVSDEISLDRTVPDMREKECKHWDYPEDLPTASVIFIFHNEGWSTLLRSVHSVINRSPARFLHEIVLVDDKSELNHLHEPLEEELKKPYYQGKVKLVRNKEREGLIRARNNGAIAATGDVVVFLDAHCEVGINWLPPLLAPIYDNPKTLTVPVIDGIQWDDFSINPVYAEGSHSRGIFEWGMLYKEGPLPPKEANKRARHSEPYNSPTHAGGLFAIRRDWFKQLGWYDPGLLIWGGENYELAFKLWQCGGRSLWVPCSRVGHVYRGHSCSSCHSGNLGRKWGNYPLTLRNYKRLIEVWFDEKYKEFFYTREPLARFIDHGDISEQLALKNRMNCKSFSWFMKEIAYDVFDKYPELPPNKHWGEIKNHANGQCIDTYSRSPPGQIGASSCHGWGGNQLFRLNTKGQLSSGEWCVEYHPTKDHMESHFIMAWCRPGVVDGPFSFEESSGFLKHGDAGKCVVIHPTSLKLVLATCDKNSKHHKWSFKHIKPKWQKNDA